MCSSVLAEAEESDKETLIGVADVERILQSYRRAARVRAELEQYQTSEEYRRKQEEVTRLEREFSNRRFSFFRDRSANKEILKKRDELSRLAEKEARRAREREKEAVEQLMIDIRRSAESMGRQNSLALIFDSNTPHILFMTTQPGKIDDITDAVIEDLNSR
jgi:Skp family chaperone for outer membrane proteins